MQGMDPRRVALLGSMSRSLTPTINVGWVVAPPRWVEPVRNAYQPALSPPALTQLALANFMESGAYDRHLRASRQRFRARRNALLAALKRELPGLPVSGAQGGLHLLLELPDGTDVTGLVATAKRHDMELCDPDEFRLEPEPGSRLLPLGYANLNDAVADEAVAILATLIRSAAR
jgi:GntR family transcriptional regulator/MocR family aminotransferase